MLLLAGRPAPSYKSCLGLDVDSVRAQLLDDFFLVRFTIVDQFDKAPRRIQFRDVLPGSVTIATGGPSAGPG